MIYSKHKAPVDRILSIVKRLYAGETLNTYIIADEYKVCSKTIGRDFKKIANIIDLENNKGNWSLKSDS